MISKYITGGLGIAILLLSTYSFYLNGVVEDKIEEIGMIKVQLITCEASSIRLTKAIEHQNLVIGDFNKKLVETNARMNGVRMDNNNLKRTVDEKVIQLNKMEVNTCEETIQWLLDDAIANKP